MIGPAYKSLSETLLLILIFSLCIVVMQCTHSTAASTVLAKAEAGGRVVAAVDWGAEFLRLTKLSLSRLAGRARPVDQGQGQGQKQGRESTAAGASNISASSAAGGVLSKVHLLRIPKASSTALSTVARRLVGTCGV